MTKYCKDAIEAAEIRKHRSEVNPNWTGIGYLISSRTRMPLETILNNPDSRIVVFRKAVHSSLRSVLEGVGIVVYDCVTSDKELNELMDSFTVKDKAG